MTPTASSTPLRKSGDLSSDLFTIPAANSYSSQPHDRNGGQGQPSLPSGVVSQSPISPKTEGMMLSLDMARSSSMPTFTARENQASKEKDEALGINRGGDTFVWLDDESVSEHGEIAIVTPMEEPKQTGAHTFADVHSRFSEFTWDRAGPPLFADPFEKSGQATPPMNNPCPLTNETSPGRLTRRAENPRKGSLASDPTSPTQRPAMLRYRSSPDLQAQDAAGLNIVLASSSSQTPISPWYTSTADSTSSDDGKSSSSSPKVSISESGSVVLMSRSVGHTGTSTLANLLPRLSYAPLALQGMDIPKSNKRSSSGSRRGSWAQLNVVDFSPPAVTLGREYRSRFHSVDSALQRNSDAASLFGSVQSTDWMKPSVPKNDEWTRRSTDWSASFSRRGSDPNARRRSSLVRTAYANLHLNRPGSVSFAAPPMTNSNFFGQEFHESTVPGLSRGFRFGSAVSGLSNLAAPDIVLREVDEVAEDPDWYTRRGSWAEV
ncbi:hypothetical protein QFC20_004666 [Naganishia adeliensis]|uniref:Uncharacterized protein n=1 Tax=Naganishia adeliensis TaxID=92952 RepID=A0ACC2VYE3_9TREE|nr:hypothetical protein QFC20_004666 [Naganishia adeliensis]